MAINDQLLVWKFNRGSTDALCSIYKLYKQDLFCLALSLVNDRYTAEDIVHDVFVNFASLSGNFKLRGSLKGYLCVCTANRARDLLRRKGSNDISLDPEFMEIKDDTMPDQNMIANEQTADLKQALDSLPFSQREVILMHLHHDLTFREIACMQNVSINTVQSRYRYGIEKLNTLLTARYKDEICTES